MEILKKAVKNVHINLQPVQKYREGIYIAKCYKIMCVRQNYVVVFFDCRSPGGAQEEPGGRQEEPGGDQEEPRQLEPTAVTLSCDLNSKESRKL